MGAVKTLLRAALTVGLLWLLTLCVSAGNSENLTVCAPDVGVEVSDAYRQCVGKQERLWNSRVPDAELSIRFILTDCGEKKVDFEAQGCLDLTYRFEHTYWTGYRCGSGGCRTEEAQDHYGDGATLRVRAFVWQPSVGAPLLCILTNLVSADGSCWTASISDDNNVPTTHKLMFSFESYAPPENGPVPDEAVCGYAEASCSSDPESENAEPLFPDSPERTNTRSFTWLSSDERVLWSVELRGSFLDGQCVEADGAVLIRDESWECEEASFFVQGGCAVAFVTLRRYTLGVPVAERSFEFRIPPPARAFPSG